MWTKSWLFIGFFLNLALDFLDMQNCFLINAQLEAKHNAVLKFKACATVCSLTAGISKEEVLGHS